MRNKGQVWMLAIIGIVLGVMIIGVTTYFIINAQPQATVGAISSQCTIKSSGVTSSTYSCPSSASFCTINVELSCSSQVTSPKVIFRTASLNLRTMANKIAWDVDSDGDLDCFIKGGNPSPTANIPHINGIRLPARMGDIQLFGNTQQIFAVKSTTPITQNNYQADPDLRYFAGSGCDLSSTVRDANFDITQGDINSFQCTQSTTGSKVVSVTYSGSKAGTKNQSIVLNKGESLGWNGKIYYSQETVKQSQCTSPKAGSTPRSYFECKADNDGCGVYATAQTFCSGDLIWKDSEKACGVPYTLIVTTSKTVYGMGEAILGSIELKDTSKRDFVEMTVSLKDNLGRDKAFTIVSTNSQGKAAYSLPAQNLEGDYTVTVEADHPDGRIPIKKDITVAQPINLRISPFPDQIQYNSEPIMAKAFVTDNQGNARDAKSWDVSGTKCGNTDVSNNVQIQRLGRTDQGTEYLLSTPISTSCTFIYKVVAIDDSGFKSIADAASIDVKDSEIQIKPELSAIQDADAGRHTIKFKTLSPNLQPIATTNIVVVTDSDGCESGKFCLNDNVNIPPVVISGSKGEYTFTHNFKDGLNTFSITSSGPGIQSSTQTFTVNLFPSSSQDPIGGGTDDGGVSVGVIVTVILVILGMAGMIYIIFRKKDSRGDN